MSAEAATAPTAPERKMTTKDRDTTLADIRRRVADCYKSHGEAIEQNEFLRFGAGLFAEMKFLLGEVDRLQKAVNKAKAPLED